MPGKGRAPAHSGFWKELKNVNPGPVRVPSEEEDGKGVGSWAASIWVLRVARSPAAAPAGRPLLLHAAPPLEAKGGGQWW